MWFIPARMSLSQGPWIQSGRNERHGAAEFNHRHTFGWIFMMMAKLLRNCLLLLSIISNLMTRNILATASTNLDVNASIAGVWGGRFGCANPELKIQTVNRVRRRAKLDVEMSSLCIRSCICSVSFLDKGCLSLEGGELLKLPPSLSHGTSSWPSRNRLHG